jgi:hypothetical protein
LPILVFVLSESFLFALANNDVTFSGEVLREARFSEPSEAAYRLKMLGMAFLVLAGSFAINIKFFSDIKQYFRGKTRNILWSVYAIVASVALTFLTLMAFLTRTLRGVGQDRMGRDLFEILFSQLNTVHNTPAYWSKNVPEIFILKSSWSETIYEISIFICQVAITLSVAALITGSISCLAKLPEMSDKDSWKYQRDRFKTYIFVSAAFLVTGVLYFKSWADYPAFLLENDKAGFAAYTYLSSAYTSFVGIQYSLILAAYALPISYTQAREADLIANNIIERRPHEASQAATVRKTKVYSVKHMEELELSTADTIKLILAVVGPFMTGALTTFSSIS